LSLVLFFAVVLVYQPVWYGGFTWDDDDLITANPSIIGPLGLKEIWTTHAADICPLTITSFWVEHALWGLAPLPYHLTTVCLHGACAVVLWRVLRSLAVPGAWLGAALWALHPVLVDSVAWITEMKNTQSGLFFLLSILFYLKFRQTPDDGNRARGRPYVLSLVFAALAMASKSSTVVLPVVLCLCAWWSERRWNGRNLTALAPMFLMSMAAGAVSIWTQRRNGAEDPHWVLTWPQSLVAAGDAVWFYLGKLIWPRSLALVYPRWQIEADSWISYLPLLAVMIVLVVWWSRRRSWARPWFFAAACFLVALLPVLGLVSMTFSRYSLVADHFQYLAAMAPLALAGAGMARWADFAPVEKSWLYSTLGAGVLLILGLLSWQRAWVYENDETLWTDTLTRNPDCWVGHNNLGSFLRRKGELDQAMSHFERAAEINPNYAEAHNNLGNALVEMDRTDEAIPEYEKALAIRPAYAEAHNNLGIALGQKGRLAEAIVQFQQALEIRPDLGAVHTNLAVALFKAGRMAEAVAQFQEVVRLHPDDGNARINLARARALAERTPGSK
jgi:tetratricopeptide (TPR) repeat protein